MSLPVRRGVLLDGVSTLVIEDAWLLGCDVKRYRLTMWSPAAVKGEAFVVGDFLMQVGELSSEMFFIEEGLVGDTQFEHLNPALLSRPPASVA